MSWLARIKERKKEQVRQLHQKQLEDSIAAFEPPTCPYVLLMYVGYYARLIQVNLERGGLEIRIAHTNIEALAKMEIATPRVLICYTGICESSGAELLKSVRSDPKFADVSVVVVAQRENQNEMLPDMKQLGATECFPLPFPPLEFVAAVCRLM